MVKGAMHGGGNASVAKWGMCGEGGMCKYVEGGMCGEGGHVW